MGKPEITVCLMCDSEVDASDLSECVECGSMTCCSVGGVCLDCHLDAEESDEEFFP